MESILRNGAQFESSILHAISSLQLNLAEVCVHAKSCAQFTHASRQESLRRISEAYRIPAKKVCLRLIGRKVAVVTHI